MSVLADVPNARQVQVTRGASTQLGQDPEVREFIPGSTITTGPRAAGMSYGPDSWAGYGRTGWQVAELLSGAKPGDLPIEQPNIFEIANNLRTAETFDPIVPLTLLLSASRIIG